MVTTRGTKLGPVEDSPVPESDTTRPEVRPWLDRVSVALLVVAITLLLLGLKMIHETHTRMSSLRQQSDTVSHSIHTLRNAVSSRHNENLVFLKILYLNRRVNKDLARRIARSVCEQCESRGIDPNLALAIIHRESHFKPRAKSKAGAKGLMQIMPNWERIFRIEDVYDIDENIEAGLKVLSMYIDMYQDLSIAIAAYNKGPGVVDWDLIRDREPTNKYSGKVLKTYKELKGLEVK